MQQKKTSNDPLADLQGLIQEAAEEAMRLNPQLGIKSAPLSDDEWQQRVREDEQMYQKLDALLQGGGGLSVSAQIIEDRGE